MTNMTASAHLVLDFDGVLAPYGPDSDLRVSADGQLLYSPRVVGEMNRLVRSSGSSVTWMTTREDDVHTLSTSIGLDFAAPALMLADGLDEIEIKIDTLDAWLRSHTRSVVVWVDDAISRDDLPSTTLWSQVSLLSPDSAGGLTEAQLVRIEMLLKGDDS